MTADKDILTESHLLVVDDDPRMLEKIKAYFEARRCRVSTAADGDAGIDLFGADPPDLVILSLKLSGRDGLQVLARMKEHAPDTPVILVAEEGTMRDAVRALRLGAYDFITKPIRDMARLAQSVRKALEKLERLLEGRKHNRFLEQQIEKRTLDLKENQKRLLEIIDRFHGFIYIVRKDYTFEFMNRKMRSYYGLDARDKFCYQVIFGVDAPCPDCHMDEILKKQSIQYEKYNPHYSRWYDMTCFRVSNADTGEYSFQFVAVDITKQKAKEARFRGNEIRLKKENIRLKSTLRQASGLGAIVGRSRVMQEVYEEILKAAESDANVIIYGDSGTGKELAAKMIHQLSVRAENGYVAVNCGAIPDNLFESEFFGYKKGAFTGADMDKHGYLAAAHQGTLFMDEIGELSKMMQVKLLRAMEGGRYTPIGSSASKTADVRIIAATNRNLEEEMFNGTFRQDFFYRIHVIPIYIPALKERKEDLPLLIQHFAQMYSDDKTIRMLPDYVVEKMLAYDWPGNVRELQNAVQQYVTLQKMEFIGSGPESAGKMEDPGLPSAGSPSDDPLNVRLQRIEKQYIRQCLEKNKWHKTRTAMELGIDRRSLFRKIRNYGL